MSDLTSNPALLKSLSCAALSPGLRSVLVFDAPPMGLQRLSSILEQFLRITTKIQVHAYQLGPFASDDDVWGSMALPGKAALHRLFSLGRNACELQLITIADLAALSQVSARTCITLIGADLAYLERHEQHQCWPLDQCWLAGCARDDVGKISPHLLDRFALRLQWQDIDPDVDFNHEMRIASLLAHVPRESLLASVPLSLAILQQLEKAVGKSVEAMPEALSEVLAYISPERYYPRREIALARFALALAQLEEAPVLLSEHVKEAARLLGVGSLVKEQEEEREDQQGVQPHFTTEEGQAAWPDTEPAPVLPQTRSLPETQTVTLPETTYSENLELATLCSEDPFPEDRAPIEREVASLQLAPTRYAPSRSAHGPIIGVEASDTLHDLAITSTILTALKFQPTRNFLQKAGQQEIIIAPTDLRCYRRGTALEHVLMVLLDYTSVSANPNWQETMLPYLSKAYSERAGIIIIQVGARHAASQLQAEIVSARNITVPAIGEAFEEQSGLASPLAHGFILAQEKLRHLLQHGRATSQQVLFLVISDGRGNVPSLVSLKGSLLGGIITREGITDALREAAQVSGMQRVETIVLNPQPTHYPELPGILARALGAEIHDIPLTDDEAEE